MNKIKLPVIIECAYSSCDVNEQTFMFTKTDSEYIEIIVNRMPGREVLFEVEPPKEWTYKYLQGWLCPKHRILLEEE